MGSFICRQPNGLYCRFSTVVDTFTHINMTEQDYIDYYCNKGFSVEEAKDVLANYVRPLSEAKERFVPNNNTVEEFNEMLTKMGETELLNPDDYKDFFDE